MHTGEGKEVQTAGTGAGKELRDRSTQTFVCVSFQICVCVCVVAAAAARLVLRILAGINEPNAPIKPARTLICCFPSPAGTLLSTPRLQQAGRCHMWYFN